MTTEEGIAQAKTELAAIRARRLKNSTNAPKTHNTRRIVAAAMGISENTVWRAKKIDEADKAGFVEPETMAALRAGRVTVNAVFVALKRAGLIAELARKRKAGRYAAVFAALEAAGWKPGQDETLTA